MCAIAGYLSLGTGYRNGLEILRRMADVQVHRGPDGEGFFADHRVGLAHRRLSIVGGESGVQPLHNEDGSIQVVANGEFFDYVEKRKELESMGHRFSTRSDCEIIVHLWEEFGEAMLDHLHGQFAFALWDQRKEVLFLARDRVGICPLHWAVNGDTFYFSSEVKGILASGEVPIQADPKGLDHVFSFMGLPTHRTCFEGISSLLPGHCIALQFGKKQTIRPRWYWDLKFPDQGEENNPRPEQVVEEFSGLLQAAVDRRLRADVPVCSYLSGGIDSSFVLYLASVARRGVGVPSYTIEIPTPGLNELDAAKTVAKFTSSPHNVTTCGANIIGENYPGLVWSCDSPVMDTSCAALWELSSSVNRSGIKSVLTGEGADEALAGYSWFKVNRLMSLLDSDEFMPSNLIRRFAGKWQGRTIPWEEARVYQDQIGGAHAMADFYALLRRGRHAFYSDDMWKKLGNHSPFEDITLVGKDTMDRWSPLNRSLYFGYKTLLPGLLLNHKGDRPAMSHSVETRYPFLDDAVIDYCAGLHPRWKLRGLTRDKYLLRLSAAPHLPAEITQRRKHMFQAPFAQTFFSEPPAYVDQLLSEESLNKTGYFSTEAIRKYYLAQKSGSIGKKSIPVLEMALTSVMATQLWHHLYFKDSLCELDKADLAKSPHRAETPS